MEALNEARLCCQGEFIPIRLYETVVAELLGHKKKTANEYLEMLQTLGMIKIEKTNQYSGVIKLIHNEKPLEAFNTVVPKNTQ